MTCVRFAVPVAPLGVNRAYAPARWGKRHGFRLTPEGQAFKDAIAFAGRRAMRGAEAITGEVEVRLLFVYPSRRNDIDGPAKLTLDALEHGRVYGNDRQVSRLVVEKRCDPEAPRVEVEVIEVTE